MAKHEVRLLMEVESPDPVMAVEEFIENLITEGMRGFIYRVQDLDNDPQGLKIMLVYQGSAMTVEEAAKAFDVPLDEDWGDDDPEPETDGDVVNGATLL